jgi:uncharacterized protein YdaU (DUF1376 family)
MSRAWMPLYWGDYLRDTRDLSTLQHGAYLLLIAHYWQHGGLPDDERALASIAGVPRPTWRRIAPALATKFAPGWRHKRIDAEIARTEHAITQRRIAGAKGGHKTALARAIAVGSALKAAKANPLSNPLRNSSRMPAAAAAPLRQPVGIHNQNPDSSSAQDAAPRHKRPHELTRAEIDAITARRRTSGDAS